MTIILEYESMTFQHVERCQQRRPVALEIQTNRLELDTVARFVEVLIYGIENAVISTA